MEQKKNKGIVLPFVSAAYRVHPGGVWSQINSLNRNKKECNDWQKKLFYAFIHCPKAVPFIIKKMFITLFKWQLLLFKQLLFK